MSIFRLLTNILEQYKKSTHPVCLAWEEAEGKQKFKQDTFLM